MVLRKSTDQNYNRKVVERTGIQTDVFAKDIFFSWRAKNKVLVSYIKLIMFAEFRAKDDYKPI